jgi:hypothetical protein
MASVVAPVTRQRLATDCPRPLPPPTIGRFAALRIRSRVSYRSIVAKIPALWAAGAGPEGFRPAVITPTTILDTPHVEANRLRRVSRMPETPKRYALWEGRSVVGREIPKE